jgi:two-component sensor histidine kinase
MRPQPFRTLLVEDNTADSYFVKKLLHELPPASAPFGSFALNVAACLADALSLLKADGPDVMMLDLMLPDSQGLDTLRSVRDVSEVPVVVLTGSADSALALQALELGAQDFLQKEELTAATIARTLRYAIERRRSQNQLLGALREKEVLLRELNHRAKNNLQVITSLLSMQARRSGDAGFRALVGAARERIDSIALAHEQLYLSENLARVDFSGYLKTLASAVFRSHGGEARGIRLELDVGRHELPLDRAVTAGLVVNELLTNAFKHAFPGDNGGEISLSLSRSDEQMTITIKDDGVGLGEGAHGSGRPLGLELVATLAQQLQATLEHKPGGGTQLSLSFAGPEAA